jgi:hypothetical protein
MPCKTVVFMKDSENLDTVAYKQMAGRAGRRGFDHLGYVTPPIPPLLLPPLLLPLNVALPEPHLFPRTLIFPS